VTQANPAGLAADNAQLDLVNVAGEVARRAQSRELGASVVTALFRLVKLATLHALDNQAVIRQIDDTVLLVNEYGARTEHNVSILFAHGSVFVGGQLLRANRGIYEGALELGDILAKVGAAELGIMRDVKAQDFYAFVSAMAEALRNPRPPRVERPSPRIRLRGLSASALGREVAVERADSREDPRAVIARTYASAIVIMRRFLEAMRKGRYELPQRVKRVAQRLVDLSAGETPAFLGVTSVRNQNHDDAGRAVNSAILALAMARQVDEDPIVLSRIAMAALLADCARARIAGIVGQTETAIVPKLSEYQDDEVPAGTAVVLTALGRVNEPSIVRTVLTYEAHWVRREERIGPLYRGLRAPTLQARILATARAFNDRVTPSTGEAPVAADEAIEALEREANDNVDRTVLRLLVGALGLFPTGTLVELSTGEVALVVHTPTNPAQYSQPKVRVVLDASGASLPRPIEIDLAQRPRQGEPPRHIRRVVATSDDPAAAALRASATAAPLDATVRPPGASGVVRGGGRGGDGSGVHSGELSAMTPHSSEASRAPLSSPWTPSPGSVSSGHHSVVPTLTSAAGSGNREDSKATRPAPARGLAQGGRVNIVEVEELDEDALEDAEGAVENATRAMSADDRLRLLGGRIDDEETSPNDRSSALPPRISTLPDAARDPRVSATVRPQRAIAAQAQQPAAQAAPPSSRRKPTAEGTLSKTPLVHLLVYMLDQRLTGTTLFTEPGGAEHAVLFEDGAPAKVRSGVLVAPLDRVILEHGLLDEATLSKSLIEVSKRRVLHGRYLVSQGLLEREVVVEVLRLQLVKKLAHLFELPQETKYAYYAGENLIADYGGPELLPVEPLAVIMSGVRSRAGDAVVDATLGRVAGRPLALHNDAEVRRFELHRDEAAVTDLLRGRRMSVSELIDAGVAQERVVKTTLYALAITRSLDLGAGGRSPVGIGRPAIEPPHVRGAKRVAPAAAASTDESPSQVNASRARTGFGLGFGRPVTSADAPPSSQRPAPQARPREDGPAHRPTTKLRRPTDLNTDLGPTSPRTPISVEMSPPPASARAPVALDPPRARAPIAVEQPGARAPIAMDPPAARAAPTREPPPPPRPPVAAPATPTKVPPAPPKPSPPTKATEAPKSTAAPGSRRFEIEQRAATIDAQNHFERLGVALDASPDQVQSTYFGLAKAWHPDRLPDDLSDLRPQVARVFAKLNEAFQILNDAKKRADYRRIVDQGGGKGEDDEKIRQVVDAALSFQNAEALLKKNDLVGAEQLAQAAVRGDPEQPEYLVLYVWIQAMRRGDPPPFPEGGTTTHFDDLIRPLDGVLSKEPRFERALFYRGSLLKRAGRTEKAIRDFRVAAEINPKNIDAVREVRLYEMRKRGGAAQKGGATQPPGEGGGLLGKLWKR
jgi:curved DNA-binding protein CbpA